LTDNGFGAASGEDLKDRWTLNQEGFMAGDLLRRIICGKRGEVEWGEDFGTRHVAPTSVDSEW
jgi:hypothetical protein